MRTHRHRTSLAADRERSRPVAPDAARRAFSAMLEDAATLYCGAPAPGETLRDVAASCRRSVRVVLRFLREHPDGRNVLGPDVAWALRIARDRAARYGAVSRRALPAPGAEGGA